MALRLTLTGEGVRSPGQARLLTQGSLSFGRGPGNDWVLPDPDRHLSKTHCVVGVERGQYVLTDLSTNGVYVNGASQPTSRDDRILLTDGDDFRIGTYVVRVEEVDDAAPLQGPGAQGGLPRAAAPLHPGAYGADPFGADPVGGRGRSEDGSPLDIDPLDDPLGRPPDPAFRHPLGHHAAVPRPRDPFDQQDEKSPRPSGGFGDDAGPYVAGSDGRTGGLSGGLSGGLGAGGPDPDEDLFRGVAPSPHWQGAAQPDHADAPVHAFVPPRALHASPGAPQPGARTSTASSAAVGVPPNAFPGGIDFDALIGDLSPAAQDNPFASPAPAPLPQAAPRAASLKLPAAQPGAPPAAYPPSNDPFGPADDLLAPSARPAVPPAAAPEPVPAAAAAVQAARSPPSPPQEGAPFAGVEPPPPPAQAPRAPGAAAPEPVAPAPRNDAAALAAFLAGAGLGNVPVPPGDPEGVLRAAGQVFRAMAEGLREVLMSRAAIKGEMRVEQTMIRARDNNALKFSVTPDEAVAALLGASRPGYMPPLNAAREAFSDIKSHELAVMAGVQEALVSLLRRFDPEALEKRLAAGLLDSVLPGARKARLWDGFKQVYGDIAREAEDDFQAVFGREFARAYAAQSAAQSASQFGVQPRE